MNLDSLAKLIVATTFAFPDSEEPKSHPTGVQIVLERHETTSLTLETSGTTPHNQEAGLIYVFPSLALNMDRANQKKLKKMNKKFFNPKGFSLQVLPVGNGISDAALIYGLHGSEDVGEIKRIHDQFTMLAMFAFQGISDLVQ
jgi:hypothetical protein